MRMPMHGYLIVKIANDQIGPWAKISSGTLSTILNKLEQIGLIAILPQEPGPVKGNRHMRTFMITEEGRKRFHQLMMDTSSKHYLQRRIMVIYLIIDEHSGTKQ